MRKTINTFVARLVFCFVALIIPGCGQNDAQEGDSVAVVYPIVVRELDHDSAAFTQGLVWSNGYIFESTGLYGQSSLRKIDPQTGEILQIIPRANVFAEGLCWWEDMLVQLTWRENTAFIYDYPSLALTGTFSYSGEGWGLTRHDNRFIMSDGSATLSVRNNSFQIVDRIEVSYQGRPLNQLNELETVAGSIYANVWHSDMIFQIDPSNGKVVRIIDCGELVTQAKVTDPESVLNGIAWKPETNTFFLTGKRWPVMYEVRIPES